MVSERLTALAIAGLDSQIQEMKHKYFRIIQREPVEFEGDTLIKLSEIHDGITYLLCVASPQNASRFLIGWMEEIDLKKER